ncbi:hypothetical protein [Acinetobacter sp. MB5]|uniref:hypothetical protein n=1 Tax=Acinetobacter sp. MB5 TaxID=2069438 RepID=UPI000DCFA69D|nr:hypothetical protein [Acinetobacter sp. MB5]
MMYQYRCACCNQVVLATDKTCPNCGSHNIRSPFGFWFFCCVAGLVVALGITLGKMYLKNHPVQAEPKSVVDFLSSGKNTN